MMKMQYLIIVMLLYTTGICVQKSVRIKENFDFNRKFMLNKDDRSFARKNYAGKDWEEV